MKSVLFRVLVAVAMILLLGVVGADGKKKNKEVVVTAKVWLSDGTVYEGPLVKHWFTRRQTYMASNQNYHILPDPNGKSVKMEVADTDSILITAGNSDEFEAGEFFISNNNMPRLIGGPRKVHKMLKRLYVGRTVDMYRLRYWGNCRVGGIDQDQLLELWILKFHDEEEGYVFFDNPVVKGCNKARSSVLSFAKEIAGTRPSLADAVTQEFAPDKETTKHKTTLLAENPRMFLDFIDDYLTANQR